MRRPPLLALALCAGLAAAAFPAAPACVGTEPMPGGWFTVHSAAAIPMDKVTPALKEKLSQPPYNEFWGCPDARTTVNLEQACSQVVAGQNVQVVALFSCSQPKTQARVMATAYIPLHDQPVKVTAFWARGWWGPYSG